MRQIDYIIIHCTATSPKATVTAIKKYWKEVKEWEAPGYHYMIRFDGGLELILPIKDIANGAVGYNYDSIHIAYIGGMDSNNLPKDTRTTAQKTIMAKLIRKAQARFPDAVVLGHCDLPDVRKTCPNFNVIDWITEYDETHL